MPLTTVEKNQQIFSLTLEERSSGYQDLVSNNSALFSVLKRKGLWRPFSGPAIRERLLYNRSGSTVWYNGYDFLNPVPVELFNDAEYRPKMAATSVVLSNEEILLNEGDNQLMDIVEAYVEAAEVELKDAIDVSLHGNGTAFGGKELTGLQATVPTVTNTGTYAGIDRSLNASWRTSSFDANSAFPTIGTQVNSTTIRAMLTSIMIQRQRGGRAADLFLMSSEHYTAFEQSLVASQRVVNETGLGKLGFTSLEYIGGGRRAEIVMEGGIGSNMPANTTYGLDTGAFRMRYHPSRNFDKLAKEMLMPLNQDAGVQYIGFMGELTMNNPLFTWKLYDSNPAA